MRSIAMDFGRDVVAGAVREEFVKTRAPDYVPGSIIGFPSSDGLIGGIGLFDFGDGSIPGLFDDGEDVLFVVAGLAAYDAGPGDVVPDGVRAVGQLGKDVDEDELAVHDGRVERVGGLVVGVSGVGAGGAVGTVVGPEALALHAVPEERDDFVLVGVTGAADAIGDVLEAGAKDAVQAFLRN